MKDVQNARSCGMERHMKTLAYTGLGLVFMSSAALAKSGLPALDTISDFFSVVSSHSSWLLVAAIAFVVYIAGSAHRA